jgi:hypothetical protein
MAANMMKAFEENYGNQYRASVNVWKANIDDYKKEGFEFNDDWAWLGKHEYGFSYFIAVRPKDVKPVNIFANISLNFLSILLNDDPSLVALRIIQTIESSVQAVMVVRDAEISTTGNYGDENSFIRDFGIGKKSKIIGIFAFDPYN